MARMRITMGLTLRRTARRINRLNGASRLILSAYVAPPHSQTPEFLALSDMGCAIPSTLRNHPVLGGLLTEALGLDVINDLGEPSTKLSNNPLSSFFFRRDVPK